MSLLYKTPTFSIWDKLKCKLFGQCEHKQIHKEGTSSANIKRFLPFINFIRHIAVFVNLIVIGVERKHSSCIYIIQMQINQQRRILKPNNHWLMHSLSSQLSKILWWSKRSAKRIHTFLAIYLHTTFFQYESIILNLYFAFSFRWYKLFKYFGFTS